MKYKSDSIYWASHMSVFMNDLQRETESFIQRDVFKNAYLQEHL